jgi:hypothetical protein
MAAVVALAIATGSVLTACDGDEPSPSEQGVTSQPGQVGGAFTGLYLTGPVTVLSTQDHRLELVSGMGCGELAQMLGAGQWAALDELILPAGTDGFVATALGLGSGLLLSRDDRLAFATFTGSDQCSAVVSDAATGTITMSGGGLPGESKGWTATTQCITSGTEKVLYVTVYLDTDARTGGIIRFALRPTGDGYELATGNASDFTVLLVSHGDHVLRVLSQAFLNPDGNPPAGVTVRQMTPGEKIAGSATRTTGRELPAGNVSMQGLVDQTTGEEVAISFPFSCSSNPALA